MPGSTPNRGYPFPIDSDGVDYAQHVEDLGRAVDTDAQGIVAALDLERAQRIAADASLSGQAGGFKVRANIGGVPLNTNLVIQGAYGEMTTDGLALVYTPLAIPYDIGNGYVAFVNNSSNLPHVMQALLLEPTGFMIGTRLITTGAPAASTTIAYTWLTIGYAS